MGRRLARILIDDGRAPLAFSDSDASKQGTMVEGIEVLSPKAATERFGDNAAFVVSKWSPGDGYLDVERQLLELGAQVVAPLPVFIWRYADRMLPHYLFAMPDTLLGFAEEIAEAFDLLDDDESRDQFLGQLEWRLLMDYHSLPEPRRGLQYFEPEIIHLGQHERFVDCGAFDGDTLRPFLRESEGVFDRAYAFEPDPDNFELLRGFISGLDAGAVERITITPAAVGDEECTLRFDGGGTTSAKLADVGEIEVKCVRLDDVVDSATYIKMDIEGAETGAIKGAPRLLAAPGTRLAVSLYHTPTDFFRLITLTHSMMPEAILRCRSYEVDALEFVLYATPE
jgi:FkbM family methyltransferase